MSCGARGRRPRSLPPLPRARRSGLARPRPFPRAWAGNSCPADIGGEAHQDATLFSGGLWDVRATLDASEAAAFDLAVFEAMNAAPTGDLGYEDLAGIIIESVKGSSLGSAVADALTAAFTKRGVLPGCDRILEYGMGPLSGPKKLGGLWMSPGLGSANLDKAPYAPGVIQVHVALPERTVSLDVKLQASSSGGGLGMGGTPFAPKLLVRFDAPITFAYGPFAAADGTSEVQLGNSDRSYGATITDVPEGATDAYVMVANAGDQDGVYTSLAITPTTAPPSGEEPPPGGEPPVDIPKERISDPPSPSGCDCAAAGEPDGSAASGLAAVALALMGSWALRRARRLG